VFMLKPKHLIQKQVKTIKKLIEGKVDNGTIREKTS
jgi:hypothetical protein